MGERANPLRVVGYVCPPEWAIWGRLCCALLVPTTSQSLPASFALPQSIERLVASAASTENLRLEEARVMELEALLA